MADSIRGVVLPVITPFIGGRVDLPGYRRLVEHYLEQGVHGNPAPIKYHLAKQGLICSAEVRPPLAPITDELAATLDGLEAEGV